jgi:hypothetical protein
VIVAAGKSGNNINLINQSIDLRDGKKGEFLRLKSQANICSPINKDGDGRRDLLL